MSRFTNKTSGINTTTNYEGEVAYKLSPEMELYTAICCASLQPKFYVPNVQDDLDRIKGLVRRVDPEFVAKLAVYAREQMYLRSIPLVLTVELAKICSGSLLQALTTRIIQRADEITEILGYYQLANQRTETKKLNKLSSGIKKGIAESFHKFDEYQFAKYNRDTDIKLRDALFLTHPKPANPKEEQLFKKIADNSLDTPYTWETQLSEAGQKGISKKQIWEELIDSGKVGYMAMLRNLRNICEGEVSWSHIEKVANFIANPERVKKSKQLPFRFLSAYRELKKIDSRYVPPILEALEEAVKASVHNLEGFGYNTSVLIACDVSGSMQTNISPKSVVQYYDIGLMLAMLLQHKSKNVVSGFFGNIWKSLQLPRQNILANVDEMHRRAGEVGYSTNGYLVIDWANTVMGGFDKIMIFTDCQMWNSYGDNNITQSWNIYKQKNPNSKLYLFDLVGYGKIPINLSTKDVFLIAGWSDKIFDVLKAIEAGENALSEINKIGLK